MRALILAGIAALSLAAFGDPPPSTNPTPPAARPNVGKMQKLDTNQDGVLSDQEKAGARSGRGGGGGLLKRMDANGDGQVSPAEKAAVFAALQKKNPERFKQFDTNGDGKIDPQEQQAAIQALQARVKSR